MASHASVVPLNAAAKMWDPESGESSDVVSPLADLHKKLDGGYNSTLLSPDGNTLGVCYADRVELWDVQTAKLLPEGKCFFSGAICHPDSKIHSILFNPDSTMFAVEMSCGVFVREIFGENPENREIIHEDHRAFQFVNSMAFSPDGSVLAVAGYFERWGDNVDATSGVSNTVSVRLFNPLRGGRTLIRTLKGHTKYVNSIAFSPDGNTLVSASDDKTIRLWDVHTGENLTTLQSYNGTVMSVKFSPDGKTFATSHRNCRGPVILIWNVVRFRPAYWEPAHKLSTPFVDLKYLLHGPDDMEDFSNLTITFSHDGEMLACCNCDMVVRTWYTESGKEIATFSVEHPFGSDTPESRKNYYRGYAVHSVSGRAGAAVGSVPSVAFNKTDGNITVHSPALH